MPYQNFCQGEINVLELKKEFEEIIKKNFINKYF